MNITKPLNVLKKEYPKAKYYLNFSNAFELCVAAILSAQCRDEVVNKVTAELFKKYKTPQAFTKLQEKDVSSITFYKNKAQNIREMSKIILKKHNGKVPKTTTELVELPGIGKKTANVIMQNAFGIIEGVIVDTHVIRLSQRLGWTENKNPDKIEKDLMKIISKQEWKKLPHLLKDHGRAVCISVPKCSECKISKYCPKKCVGKSN
jgi:endonuclease III